MMWAVIFYDFINLGVIHINLDRLERSTANYKRGNPATIKVDFHKP